MSRSNIPGRDAYLWLYDDFLASNPRQGAVVVEVGVALGKSISYLADRCIAEGRRDIQIYAVDTWAGTARNGEQQEMGDAAGGDFSLYCKTMLEHCPAAFEMIRPLRLDGSQAAKLFEYGSIDLVVLDGDHTYEAVENEILYWWPTLRVGGAIGGDDYHLEEYPGVVDAVAHHFCDNVETRNDQNWPTWRVRK